MLRLAEQRDRLQVVDDQLGCPTYAPDIASAIIAIARQVTGSRWNPRFAGVTHLAGPDVLSWCGFGKEIVRGAAERERRFVPVDPISTSHYPTAATAVANMAASTDTVLFSSSPRDFEEVTHVNVRPPLSCYSVRTDCGRIFSTTPLTWSPMQFCFAGAGRCLKML